MATTASTASTLLDRRKYVSPLQKLHKKHLKDIEEAEKGENMRLAKQIPYRTAEEHFVTMISRKDFRNRGGIVHRDFCFQNYLS